MNPFVDPSIITTINSNKVNRRDTINRYDC